MTAARTTEELLRLLDIAIADWRASREYYADLTEALADARYFGQREDIRAITAAMAVVADRYLTLDVTLKRILRILAN